MGNREEKIQREAERVADQVTKDVLKGREPSIPSEKPPVLPFRTYDEQAVLHRAGLKAETDARTLKDLRDRQ